MEESEGEERTPRFLSIPYCLDMVSLISRRNCFSGKDRSWHEKRTLEDAAFSVVPHAVTNPTRGPSVWNDPLYTFP